MESKRLSLRAKVTAQKDKNLKVADEIGFIFHRLNWTGFWSALTNCMSENTKCDPSLGYEVIDATHYCVKAKGVQDANSHTASSKLGAIFKSNPSTRVEFLSVIRKA
jgi:hypothetical protein